MPTDSSEAELCRVTCDLEADTSIRAMCAIANQRLVTRRSLVVSVLSLATCSSSKQAPPCVDADIVQVVRLQSLSDIRRVVLVEATTMTRERFGFTFAVGTMGITRLGGSIDS